MFKLLSVDPQNYRDAPTEAIRRVLEAVQGRKIPPGENLDASTVGMHQSYRSLKIQNSDSLQESCRIGTTIATNALLEHKGKRFALLTTKGTTSHPEYVEMF